MKPRVMSLVIFTCAVGLLMAPNIVDTKDAIILWLATAMLWCIIHNSSLLNQV